MAESNFVEILNQKQKNMIIGCVYYHPKHEVIDMNNSLLYHYNIGKLSNENKQVLLDFRTPLLLLMTHHEKT